MSKIVSFFVALMSNRILYVLGLSHVISYTIRILFACQVSPKLRVGKNFKLAYGGLGIVIHGDCEIGDNVTIGTNVTIGGNFGKGGVPKIRTGVYIASGAKVLGPITIYEKSIIAANAVVLTDVEANSIYAGIPAKKIRAIKK